MLQLEQQKEDLVNYVQSTLNNLESFVLENQNQTNLEGFEINSENTPEIKKALKELVQKIQELKQADLKFYNELLNEIPKIGYFQEEVKDLNELKKLLGETVSSSNTEENAANLANLVKSSKIFYFINKKSNKNFTEDELKELGTLGELGDYISLVWKQVKQEEILGLLLYVNSGQAAKDYDQYLKQKNQELKSDFLYLKFKQSFKNLLVKEEGAIVEYKDKQDFQDKVSPANQLDFGVIVNEKEKSLYIGFATSNYNTRAQQKQFFKKVQLIKEKVNDSTHSFYGYKLNTIYITNSLINEHALEKNDREHQKPFLKSFEKTLTTKEKNLINCASLLAIAGNLAATDCNHKLDIMDFLSINPYVSGSDTLWLHNEFKKINKLKEIERPEALRSFMINSAIQLMEVFKKLPDNEINTMTDIHAKVLAHAENMFKCAVENFVVHIPAKELFSKDFIERVSIFSNLYEKIHRDKFGFSMPDDNSIKAHDLYDKFCDKNQTIAHIQQLIEKIHLAQDRNKNLEQKKQERLNHIDKNFAASIHTILKKLNEMPSIFGMEDPKKCLKEMISLANRFPNREIKSLLRSVDASNAMHKIMKNYKNWEKEAEGKNLISPKKEILENILENIRDMQRLNEAIEKYHQDYTAELPEIKKFQKFKDVGQNLANKKRKSKTCKN